MGGQKKYLITSAQACASPHKNFLSGLEKYANDREAEIIVLPMIGESAHEDIIERQDKNGVPYGGLHKSFEKYGVEFDKRKLNDNIQIVQFHVRPYQIDPLTGLSRFAQRETTQVFASPKQRVKAIPHSNNQIPKLLVTTGACTHPNYASGSDSSAERRRLGNIARGDHTYGALVVEIESEEIFHLRNIRANNDGKFVDLGRKYDGNKVSKAELEAIVFGDWHVGYTDPAVKKANYEMIKELKPKRIFLHDFFDGHSVSPHRDKKLITEQIMEGVDKNFSSLEQELSDCRDELIQLDDSMKGREIYVVASNHHEFLDRYLDEGRFVKDPYNARFAFRLSTKLSEDKIPIEEGMKMVGKVPKGVTFLRREEDLKIRGFQLGSHGDKGPSGARSSVNSKENDYGRSITGHVHSLEVQRDTYIAGTSTPLTIFYNKGNPTSWTNSNILLYETGTAQFVNVIFGKWRVR